MQHLSDDQSSGRGEKLVISSAFSCEFKFSDLLSFRDLWKSRRADRTQFYPLSMLHFCAFFKNEDSFCSIKHLAVWRRNLEKLRSFTNNDGKKLSNRRVPKFNSQQFKWWCTSWLQTGPDGLQVCSPVHLLKATVCKLEISRKKLESKTAADDTEMKRNATNRRIMDLKQTK